MRDIYYIGGSPCSGKSTIAEMLAAEYSLAYYKLDDYLWQYMEQAAADGKPHSAAQLAMDLDRMWMRPPRLQSDEEFSIYEEMLPYALRDIGKMDGDAPVVAEGAGFTPGLMSLQGVPPDRYICIAPTEAFQRKMYAERPWITNFLDGCGDPDAAFDNWMSRDALFACEVLRQAKEVGYGSIVVDGVQSIEDNYRTVTSAFGLSAE